MPCSTEHRWVPAGCLWDRARVRSIRWSVAGRCIASSVLPLITSTPALARDALGLSWTKLTSAEQSHPLAGLKGELGAHVHGCQDYLLL